MFSRKFGIPLPIEAASYHKRTKFAATALRSIKTRMTLVSYRGIAITLNLSVLENNLFSRFFFFYIFVWVFEDCPFWHFESLSLSLSHTHTHTHTLIWNIFCVETYCFYLCEEEGTSERYFKGRGRRVCVQLFLETNGRLLWTHEQNFGLHKGQ